MSLPHMFQDHSATSFKYTVQAGDAGSNINYAGTNSLTLPTDVTIKYLGNSNFDSSPGSAKSADIDIDDQVRPSVSYQKAAVVELRSC